MIGAIVKDDIVENVIVLEEAQKAELETALGAEIVDARPYGLAVGDLRTGAGWTRNAGGEQMVLPLLDEKNYDSYTAAMQKVSELETQQKTIADAAAYTATEEALAILSGEVEE